MNYEVKKSVFVGLPEIVAAKDIACSRLCKK
jgi:hypothetical protein